MIAFISKCRQQRHSLIPNKFTVWFNFSYHSMFTIQIGSIWFVGGRMIQHVLDDPDRLDVLDNSDWLEDLDDSDLFDDLYNSDWFNDLNNLDDRNWLNLMICTTQINLTIWIFWMIETDLTWRYVEMWVKWHLNNQAISKNRVIWTIWMIKIG